MGRARRWSSPSTTRPPSGTGRTSRLASITTPLRDRLVPRSSTATSGSVWPPGPTLALGSDRLADPLALVHPSRRCRLDGGRRRLAVPHQLELAAAQIEWPVQQLGPYHPPIWVVTDGAYVKRPFLKRVLAAGVTVISRCGAMRPCGRCRRRSIPARRRVVAGRRSTARTGSTWPRLRRADPGLADRAFLTLRPAGGEEVQDVPGDLQTGGWGDPRGAGARARSLRGVLLDRPGSERGIDPRDGGRPLGAGAGLPRRQGGSWSGTARIAPCVGQRAGVEPDPVGGTRWWSCGPGTGRSPGCATGATRRGTSQSVVRRMRIAVRSHVARRRRKNIRRYRQ